jgi:hypothetical protein
LKFVASPSFTSEFKAADLINFIGPRWGQVAISETILEDLCNRLQDFFREFYGVESFVTFSLKCQWNSVQIRSYSMRESVFHPDYKPPAKVP